MICTHEYVTFDTDLFHYDVCIYCAEMKLSDSIIGCKHEYHRQIDGSVCVLCGNSIQEIDFIEPSYHFTQEDGLTPYGINKQRVPYKKKQYVINCLRSLLETVDEDMKQHDELPFRDLHFGLPNLLPRADFDRIMQLFIYLQLWERHNRIKWASVNQFLSYVLDHIGRRDLMMYVKIIKTPSVQFKYAELWASFLDFLS